MNPPNETKVRCDSLESLLPVDLWLSIIHRIDVDDFEPISLTCKLFLSITDRLRTTLTISTNTFDAGVLRRFRNIKRINVHPRFQGDLVSLIHYISTSGLPIETLDLSDQKLFPSPGVREVRKTLGKTLKTLICQRICLLSDEDLVVISEAFPALEELDISKDGAVQWHYDFSSSRKHITDAGIKALASNVPRLRRINVSGIQTISDASLSALLSNCADLSEVHILNCSMISENGIASVARRPSLVSLSMCRRRLPVFTDARALQSLYISESFLSDDDLLSIAKSSLPLREFCIPFCEGFSLKGLGPLLQAHPSLTHLNLKGCEFLTDKSMALLAQNLCEVTSIDLSVCRLTEFTFMCLVKCCPLLVELQMFNTDLGMCRDLCFSSMKKSSIHSLNVSLNINFNDETLIRISSVCPELRTVDLGNSRGVSERGLIQLGLNCPHIRSLDVSNCKKVMGLGDVGFRELVTLRASWSGIRDEGLEMAVRGCGGRLQVVDLRYSKVTKYGVIVMVRGYLLLKEIIVWGKEIKRVLEREGWQTHNDRGGFIRFVKNPRRRFIRASQENHKWIMNAKVGRATWTPEKKKMFIDLCLEQVKLGSRPGSNLKLSAWKKVREDFNMKVGVNYEQRQFKNYWDMLKKQWNAWKKLISLTGIGEVAQGQTVQMESKRWDEHIKANPDVKQFRYKPLSHADEMEQLFGRVTVTKEFQLTLANDDSLLDDFGKLPSTSHNPSPTTATFSPPTIPPDIPVLDPVHDVKRKCPCPPKPKRKEFDAFEEKIDGVLDKIVKIVNLATSHASAHGRAAPTIDDCYASLQQTPGIEPRTQLYVFALQFFTVPEHRELWMLEHNPNTRIKLLQLHFSRKVR